MNERLKNARRMKQKAMSIRRYRDPITGLSTEEINSL